MTGRQAGKKLKELLTFMTGTDSPVSMDSSTMQGPRSSSMSQGRVLSSWDRAASQRRRTVTLHAHILLHKHHTPGFTNQTQHSHTHIAHTHTPPFPHTHHTPGFTNQTQHSHTHTSHTHTHTPSPIHITHQASLIRHNIHTHTHIAHTHTCLLYTSDAADES